MYDIYSQKKRSQIMSKITGKETKTEIIVRKFLFSNGFRYRKNVSYLPGKPDIVLSKYKTVIFIHGCFWHHHNKCKYSKLPETRKEFWTKKISDNIKRDHSNIKKLKDLGWHVIVVWQCELKNKKAKYNKLNSLVTYINNLIIK